MDYYKILMKKFHPDLNNNSKFSTVVCKVIHKNRHNEELLKNLYERLEN